MTHLGSIQVTDGPTTSPAPPMTIPGTVEDHIGRYRELAEAGVQTAIVRFPDFDLDSIDRFAPVIAAFRQQ